MTIDKELELSTGSDVALAAHILNHVTQAIGEEAMKSLPPDTLQYFDELALCRMLCLKDYAKTLAFIREKASESLAQVAAFDAHERLHMLLLSVHKHVSCVVSSVLHGMHVERTALEAKVCSVASRYLDTE